ncbi:MAG: hypothetical protein ACXABG_08015 [Promethearchaeota archaeon]|jgi:hypothetical protein
MSNQFTPETIYSRVLNKEIEKKDGLTLLESIIHESNNEEIRRTALEFIGKIALEDKKTFEVIEYCLISDESPIVRHEAAKILIQVFPKWESSPLGWAIQNENSIYFFKKLIDLLETFETSQFEEIREKALQKIVGHYNLVPADSKIVLDIDFLDYMKFKTEFSNFSDKFDLEYDAKHLLIQKNTEFGYHGMGRVQKSQNGYILELLLIDLSEIPDSICFLTKLESLEIAYCNLAIYPENCPNLLSLKKLAFYNNRLEKLPTWVSNFAYKDKYIDKYIRRGVIRSETHVLGLLEILTRKECKNVTNDEKLDSKEYVLYDLDSKGHITKLSYQSTNTRIGVFPEELCELQLLEELILIDQNIRFIPNSIENLRELKLLDLSYNEITKGLESIKKLNNLKHFYLTDNSQENK